MNVGIVGTGPMGLALAHGLRSADLGVQLCSAGSRRGAARDQRELFELVDWASAIILAVPFPIALAMASGPLGKRGEGRTLVDVTNPTMTQVTNPAMTRAASPPPDRSGGERIAEAAPGWRVAKAFNTVSAAVVEQGPRSQGPPVSLPVASDHSLALRDVFVLAEALGFEPLDAGGIDSSRHLESLAVLLRQISARQHRSGRVSIHIDLDHDKRGAYQR
ncbi:hypothetical protein E1193_01200 [Micromonospora sp. KC606]|uniref:NADPH-dependent F420 reductase n=1 Tax=Micromonospora sp. KC606 TaxID=2530379 RepID=UPI00104D6A49|nr:hypothetical protein [Micromonospora sp. KC606]TDC85949.1 hypothetical protein E1193_01200 [Micromonospora sp. KC606]